ncbi:MAG: hypothetical protein AAGH15_26165 [Myxococcota bacterium]
MSETKDDAKTKADRREAVLERHPHRHELIDPATLRWVAAMLADVDEPLARRLAKHLEGVAEHAGSEISVAWTPDPSKPEGTVLGTQGPRSLTDSEWAAIEDTHH